MRLSIEGLKAVNLELNADVELGDVVVLTGTNGSGKTLLLKLFYSVVKALTRPTPEILYHGTSEVEKLTASIIDEELEKAFGGRPEISGKVALVTNSGRIAVTFDQGKASVDLTSVGDVVSELYSGFYPIAIAPVERTNALYSGRHGGILAELADIIKSNMNEARIYGRFSLNTGDLGLSVIVDSDRLYASLKGEKEIPVEQLPYGYTQIVPAVLLARSYRYLIIDEPTLNLHADAQVRLGNYIYDLVTEGKRFLIATHSETFIQQLAINQVKRGRDKGKTLKVYFLNNGAIDEIKYKDCGDIESIPSIIDAYKLQYKEIIEIKKAMKFMRSY